MSFSPAFDNCEMSDKTRRKIKYVFYKSCSDCKMNETERDIMRLIYSFRICDASENSELTSEVRRELNRSLEEHHISEESYNEFIGDLDDIEQF